jgi:hypothetical protein
MFPTASSVKLGPFSCRVIASGGAKAFAVTVAVVQYQPYGLATLRCRPRPLMTTTTTPRASSTSTLLAEQTHSRAHHVTTKMWYWFDLSHRARWMPKDFTTRESPSRDCHSVQFNQLLATVPRHTLLAPSFLIPFICSNKSVLYPPSS